MNQFPSICSLDALVAIIDVVPIPMIVKDRQHRILLVNHAGCQFMQMPAESMVGHTYYDFLSREEADAGTAIDERVFQTGCFEEYEEQIVDGSGIPRTLVTRKHLVDAGDGEVLLVGIVNDVTRYRQAEARNLHLALHDSLTGLPNRALLRDYLTQALAELADHGTRFALIYIDLDRFKAVNDRFGHQAGDAVLRQFTERVIVQLRGCDIMARLGGDEFAILARDINGAGPAAIGGRVLDVAARPFDVAGGHATIGASVGVALVTDPLIDIDEAHRRADVALYAAKDAGRGCCCIFGDLPAPTEQRTRNG